MEVLSGLGTNWKPVGDTYTGNPTMLTTVTKHGVFAIRYDMVKQC